MAGVSEAELQVEWKELTLSTAKEAGVTLSSVLHSEEVTLEALLPLLTRLISCSDPSNFSSATIGRSKAGLGSGGCAFYREECAF